MTDILNQRIIWKNNLVLTDLSVKLNNFREDSQVIDFVSADDFLYIGSVLPFNHKFVEVSVVNDVTATATVAIWFGNTWVSAVDIIDRTAVSGKPLAQSGIIQWNTNRLKGWDREDDSTNVTGLSGTAIYDMYWLRLGYSADLKATTALAYVGHKFGSDSDMYDYYPDLNNSDLKTAFESGKTAWNEQQYAASQVIIRDLKRKNIALDASQILDHELFKDPQIHKCAEMIYAGLGKAYEETRARAEKRYNDSMDLKNFNIDLTGDGSLNPVERVIRTGYMKR